MITSVDDVCLILREEFLIDESLSGQGVGILSDHRDEQTNIVSRDDFEWDGQGSRRGGDAL